jgi:beta-phosphoglucomutase family hydrolase
MNTSFPFDAVLFDMDGVVVDNMPLHRAVWADYARSRGLAPSEAEIRTLDGRRASDIILKLFGADLSESDILRMAGEREDLYASRLGNTTLQAVPGIRAFLSRLKAAGIPRVLATSAVPMNVETVLSQLGFHDLFEERVTAVDVKNGKPHPEVYLTAASRVGAQAARCLVVEDALPGVEAAKAAGASCLGLMTSEDERRLREAGADWVASDFLTLPPHLVLI